MFDKINSQMKARMEWLERKDSADRLDGTPRTGRLRQIPRDTGCFLAILAANTPEGDIIEIGTSGGYSTLWLILAGLKKNRLVITFETSSTKVEIARETFRLAGVADRVLLEHGDGRELLLDRDHIAFCFLDSEKEHYQELYELIIPRLVSGGLLVADNVISHRETLGCLVDRANRDRRIDSVVVPIGRGELLCRKL
jgi:caffeoyl-CoA O-methyltransferase